MSNPVVFFDVTAGGAQACDVTDQTRRLSLCCATFDGGLHAVHYIENY